MTNTPSEMANLPVCLGCRPRTPSGRVAALGLGESVAALLERGAAVLQDVPQAEVVPCELFPGAHVKGVTAQQVAVPRRG